MDLITQKWVTRKWMPSFRNLKWILVRWCEKLHMYKEEEPRRSSNSGFCNRAVSTKYSRMELSLARLGPARRVCTPMSYPFMSLVQKIFPTLIKQHLVLFQLAIWSTPISKPKYFDRKEFPIKVLLQKFKKILRYQFNLRENSCKSHSKSNYICH